MIIVIVNQKSENIFYKDNEIGILILNIDLIRLKYIIEFKKKLDENFDIGLQT